MSGPPPATGLPPSTLRVVHFPAPVLRARALPIVQITDHVRAVAMRMIELMHEEEGIGLAAPQVGLSWRMFVAHVPESEKEGRSANPAGGALPDATTGPVVYINPQLFDFEGPPEKFNEGCLSLPDIRGNVHRPPTVSIRAQGLDGVTFTHRATGLLARCYQHEVDHLDGILILDKMGQMDRLKNRSKVRALSG
ncbi:MAG: peptide deformylase [Phycisphaerales bacterium]